MKKIVLKSFNSRPEAERSISDSSEHEIVTTSALKSLYPRMAIPRGRFHVVLKGDGGPGEGEAPATTSDFDDFWEILRSGDKNLHQQHLVGDNPDAARALRNIMENNNLDEGAFQQNVDELYMHYLGGQYGGTDAPGGAKLE